MMERSITSRGKRPGADLGRGQGQEQGQEHASLDISFSVELHMLAVSVGVLATADGRTEGGIPARCKKRRLGREPEAACGACELVRSVVQSMFPWWRLARALDDPTVRFKVRKVSWAWDARAPAYRRVSQTLTDIVQSSFDTRLIWHLRSGRVGFEDPLLFLVQWLCQNLGKAYPLENMPVLLASITATFTVLVPPWEPTRLRSYLSCILEHAFKRVPWLRDHSQCTTWLLTPKLLTKLDRDRLKMLYCENAQDLEDNLSWWA